MRTANRFAIAIQSLCLLGCIEEGEATSEWMAESIGVNPVVVRNILGRLRRAGLVRTQQGAAGAHLTRLPTDITLLDVYNAVEEEGTLFGRHAHPNPHCPVGTQIPLMLDNIFGSAQQTLEDYLASVTLAQVVTELRTTSTTSFPCPDTNHQHNRL